MGEPTMTQQGQAITEEDVAASKGYESLGPAYFASRRIAERFMEAFEAEQFQPMIRSLSEGKEATGFLSAS
jgi:hypothetical protein